MSDPFREFIARFTALRDAYDDAEVDGAGMERWEAPTSPIDRLERDGLLDQRARAAVTSVTFPPSVLPPAEYPSDWPFLPEVPVVQGRVVVGDDDRRMFVWSELASWRPALARVQAFHAAEGWHFHVLTPEADWPGEAAADSGAGAVTAVALGAFHREATWRLLVLQRAEETVLVMLQGRYEHFWPAQGPLHAG